jgi:cytochrome P450 monooxygenase
MLASSNQSAGEGSCQYGEFIPFWGGLRICPAQQQVFTHSIYILVRLTQKFERLENCDPVYEYMEKVTLSVESMNRAKITFKLP